MYLRFLKRDYIFEEMQKMLLEGTKERVEGTRNSKNNDWRKVAFLYYDHKTRAEHLVCSVFVLVRIRGDAESLQDAREALVSA